MAEYHSTGWPSQGASQALFIREPSGEYREATPKEVVACASRMIGKLFGRGSVLSRPADSVTYLTMKLVAKDHEVFCALFLDNRYRVIAFEELFRGTINSTAVYPREVVKRALAHNAAAVIFSHNHPSGPPDPSDADRRLTETLKAALALIDVHVLDHFVIGDGSYSFAAHGLL